MLKSIQTINDTSSSNDTDADISIYKEKDPDLIKANSLLHLQNAELVLRTRTMAVMRNIYEIINTSQPVQITIDNLVRAIVQQLHFRKVSLALVNHKNRTLEMLATYPDDLTDEQEKVIFSKLYKTLQIPLDDKDNFCVNALSQNHVRLTNDMYDLLRPLISRKTATELQNLLSIQTSIIYPINFAGKPLGVLIIHLEKNLGNLSRSERDSLKELVEIIAIAIERAQTYSELQTANQRLKDLDRLKDEFVSIASHELRGPMTAIRGFVSMILSGDYGAVGEALISPLKDVESATERLIALVNDLLNVSRIESSRIAFHITEFSAASAITDVVRELSSLAQNKQLIIEQNFQESPTICADIDKFKQILINIITNAIKFTDKGGITIKLTQKPPYAHIAVTDTGVGIDKANQNKLFVKFSQVFSNQSGKPVGTGLGLYIARNLARSMGGNLRLEDSIINAGSTFAIMLPIAKTKEAQNTLQKLAKAHATI